MRLKYVLFFYILFNLVTTLYAEDEEFATSEQIIAECDVCAYGRMMGDAYILQTFDFSSGQNSPIIQTILYREILDETGYTLRIPLENTFFMYATKIVDRRNDVSQDEMFDYHFCKAYTDENGRAYLDTTEFNYINWNKTYYISAVYFPTFYQQNIFCSIVSEITNGEYLLFGTVGPYDSGLEPYLPWCPGFSQEDADEKNIFFNSELNNARDEVVWEPPAPAQFSIPLICFPILIFFGLFLSFSFNSGRNPFLSFSFYPRIRASKTQNYSMRNMRNSIDASAALNATSQALSKVGVKAGGKDLLSYGKGKLTDLSSAKGSTFQRRIAQIKDKKEEGNLKKQKSKLENQNEILGGKSGFWNKTRKVGMIISTISSGNFLTKKGRQKIFRPKTARKEENKEKISNLEKKIELHGEIMEKGGYEKAFYENQIKEINTSEAGVLLKKGGELTERQQKRFDRKRGRVAKRAEKAGVDVDTSGLEIEGESKEEQLDNLLNSIISGENKYSLNLDDRLYKSAVKARIGNLKAQLSEDVELSFDDVKRCLNNPTQHREIIEDNISSDNLGSVKKRGFFSKIGKFSLKALVFPIKVATFPVAFPLKKYLNNPKRRESKIKKEIKNLENQIEELNSLKENGNLSEDNKKKLIDLKEQLSEKTQELQTMDFVGKLGILSFINNIGDLNNEIKQKDKKIAELKESGGDQGQLKKLENELDDLKNQEEELKQEAKKYGITLTENGEGVIITGSVNAEKRAEIIAEIDDLKRNIEFDDNSMAPKSNLFSSIKFAISGLFSGSKQNQLEKEINDLENQIEELDSLKGRRELSSNEEKLLTELKEQLSDKKQEMQDMNFFDKLGILSFINKVGNLTERIQEKEQEIIQLQEKEDEDKEQLTKLENELKSLNSELDNLKNQAKRYGITLLKDESGVILANQENKEISFKDAKEWLENLDESKDKIDRNISFTSLEDMQKQNSSAFKNLLKAGIKGGIDIVSISIASAFLAKNFINNPTRYLFTRQIVRKTHSQERQKLEDETSRNARIVANFINNNDEDSKPSQQDFLNALENLGVDTRNVYVDQDRNIDTRELTNLVNDIQNNRNTTLGVVSLGTGQINSQRMTNNVMKNSQNIVKLKENVIRRTSREHNGLSGVSNFMDDEGNFKNVNSSNIRQFNLENVKRELSSDLITGAAFDFMSLLSSKFDIHSNSNSNQQTTSQLIIMDGIHYRQNSSGYGIYRNSFNRSMETILASRDGDFEDRLFFRENFDRSDNDKKLFNFRKRSISEFNTNPLAQGDLSFFFIFGKHDEAFKEMILRGKVEELRKEMELYYEKKLNEQIDEKDKQIEEKDGQIDELKNKDEIDEKKLQDLVNQRQELINQRQDLVNQKPNIIDRKTNEFIRSDFIKEEIINKRNEELSEIIEKKDAEINELKSKGVLNEQDTLKLNSLIMQKKELENKKEYNEELMGQGKGLILLGDVVRKNDKIELDIDKVDKEIKQLEKEKKLTDEQKEELQNLKLKRNKLINQKEHNQEIIESKKDTSSEDGFRKALLDGNFIEAFALIESNPQENKLDLIIKFMISDEEFQKEFSKKSSDEKMDFWGNLSSRATHANDNDYTLPDYSKSLMHLAFKTNTQDELFASLSRQDNLFRFSESLSEVSNSKTVSLTILASSHFANKKFNFLERINSANMLKEDNLKNTNIKQLRHNQEIASLRRNALNMHYYHFNNLKEHKIRNEQLEDLNFKTGIDDSMLSLFITDHANSKIKKEKIFGLSELEDDKQDQEDPEKIDEETNNFKESEKAIKRIRTLLLRAKDGNIEELNKDEKEELNELMQKIGIESINEFDEGKLQENTKLTLEERMGIFLFLNHNKYNNSTSNSNGLALESDDSALNSALASSLATAAIADGTKAGLAGALASAIASGNPFIDALVAAQMVNLMGSSDNGSLNTFLSSNNLKNTNFNGNIAFVNSQNQLVLIDNKNRVLTTNIELKDNEEIQDLIVCKDTNRIGVVKRNTVSNKTSLITFSKKLRGKRELNGYYNFNQRNFVIVSDNFNPYATVNVVRLGNNRNNSYDELQSRIKDIVNKDEEVFFSDKENNQKTAYVELDGVKHEIRIMENKDGVDSGKIQLVRTDNENNDSEQIIFTYSYRFRDGDVLLTSLSDTKNSTNESDKQEEIIAPFPKEDFNHSVLRTILQIYTSSQDIQRIGTSLSVAIKTSDGKNHDLENLLNSLAYNQRGQSTSVADIWLNDDPRMKNGFNNFYIHFANDEEINAGRAIFKERVQTFTVNKYESIFTKHTMLYNSEINAFFATMGLSEADIIVFFKQMEKEAERRDKEIEKLGGENQTNEAREFLNNFKTLFKMEEGEKFSFKNIEKALFSANSVQKLAIMSAMSSIPTVIAFNNLSKTRRNSLNNNEGENNHFETFLSNSNNLLNSIMSEDLDEKGLKDALFYFDESKNEFYKQIVLSKVEKQENKEEFREFLNTMTQEFFKEDASLIKGTYTFESAYNNIRNNSNRDALWLNIINKTGSKNRFLEFFKGSGNLKDIFKGKNSREVLNMFEATYLGQGLIQRESIWAINEATELILTDDDAVKEILKLSKKELSNDEINNLINNKDELRGILREIISSNFNEVAQGDYDNMSSNLSSLFAVNMEDKIIQPIATLASLEEIDRDPFLDSNEGVNDAINPMVGESQQKEEENKSQEILKAAVRILSGTTALRNMAIQRLSNENYLQEIREKEYRDEDLDHILQGIGFNRPEERMSLIALGEQENPIGLKIFVDLYDSLGGDLDKEQSSKLIRSLQLMENDSDKMRFASNVVQAPRLFKTLLSTDGISEQNLSKAFNSSLSTSFMQEAIRIENSFTLLNEHGANIDFHYLDSVVSNMVKQEGAIGADLVILETIENPEFLSALEILDKNNQENNEEDKTKELFTNLLNLRNRSIFDETSKKELELVIGASNTYGKRNGGFLIAEAVKINQEEQVSINYFSSLIMIQDLDKLNKQIEEVYEDLEEKKRARETALELSMSLFNGGYDEGSQNLFEVLSSILILGKGNEDLKIIYTNEKEEIMILKGPEDIRNRFINKDTKRQEKQEIIDQLLNILRTEGQTGISGDKDGARGSGGADGSIGSVIVSYDRQVSIDYNISTFLKEFSKEKESDRNISKFEDLSLEELIEIAHNSRNGVQTALIGNKPIRYLLSNKEYGLNNFINEDGTKKSSKTDSQIKQGLVDYLNKVASHSFESGGTIFFDKDASNIEIQEKITHYLGKGITTNLSVNEIQDDPLNLRSKIIQMHPEIKSEDIEILKVNYDYDGRSSKRNMALINLSDGQKILFDPNGSGAWSLGKLFGKTGGAWTSNDRDNSINSLIEGLLVTVNRSQEPMEIGNLNDFVYWTLEDFQDVSSFGQEFTNVFFRHGSNIKMDDLNIHQLQEDKQVQIERNLEITFNQRAVAEANLSRHNQNILDYNSEKLNETLIDMVKKSKGGISTATYFGQPLQPYTRQLESLFKIEDNKIIYLKDENQAKKEIKEILFNVSMNGVVGGGAKVFDGSTSQEEINAYWSRVIGTVPETELTIQKMEDSHNTDFHKLILREYGEKHPELKDNLSTYEITYMTPEGRGRKEISVLTLTDGSQVHIDPNTLAWASATIAGRKKGGWSDEDLLNAMDDILKGVSINVTENQIPSQENLGEISTNININKGTDRYIEMFRAILKDDDESDNRFFNEYSAVDTLTSLILFEEKNGFDNEMGEFIYNGINESMVKNNSFGILDQSRFSRKMEMVQYAYDTRQSDDTNQRKLYYDQNDLNDGILTMDEIDAYETHLSEDSSRQDPLMIPQLIKLAEDNGGKINLRELEMISRLSVEDLENINELLSTKKDLEIKLEELNEFRIQNNIILGGRITPSPSGDGLEIQHNNLEFQLKMMETNKQLKQTNQDITNILGFISLTPSLESLIENYSKENLEMISNLAQKIESNTLSKEERYAFEKNMSFDEINQSIIDINYGENKAEIITPNSEGKLEYPKEEKTNVLMEKLTEYSKKAYISSDDKINFMIATNINYQNDFNVYEVSEIRDLLNNRFNSNEKNIEEFLKITQNIFTNPNDFLSILSDFKKFNNYQRDLTRINNLNLYKKDKRQAIENLILAYSHLDSIGENIFDNIVNNNQSMILDEIDEQRMQRKIQYINELNNIQLREINDSLFKNLEESYDLRNLNSIEGLVIPKNFTGEIHFNDSINLENLKLIENFTGKIYQGDSLLNDDTVQERLTQEEAVSNVVSNLDLNKDPLELANLLRESLITQEEDTIPCPNCGHGVHA